MTKRIIEADRAELATLQGRELVESIRLSEGRTIAAEVVAFFPAIIPDVSNAALAAAFGPDIIHLNHYDIDKPLIAGFSSFEEGMKSWAKAGLQVVMTNEIEGPIRRFLLQLGMGVTLGMLRTLIGRVVGISLDVVTDKSTSPPGRLATTETATKAIEHGAAYITLVGTPTITKEALRTNIQQLRDGLGTEVLLVTGRMPWGGNSVDAPGFLGPSEVESLITAGADIVMLPVPGTVRGASFEKVAESVALAHQMGALVELTIGNSQESAEVETVRRLAMDGKLTGADIYQIGDGGYGGIAIPENILAFAVAIKGKRHTYRRMA